MRRWPFAALAGLGGCSASPAQNIVGSYFPSWLICAVLGILTTAMVRQVLVMAGLERHLLLPPLTYAGMAVGAALLLWLLVYGQ